MKKILAVASLLAMTALPAWAGGIGATYTGWDTDGAGNDQGGGVKVEFDIGSSFNFELRAAWLESFELVSQGNAIKLEVTPIDVGLAYDFKPGNKVAPFLGGGVSLVDINGKTSGEAIIEVDTEVGYYIVAGFNSKISDRLGFLLEVIHRDTSADIASDGFLNRDFNDFGLDLGGLGYSAGLMMRW